MILIPRMKYIKIKNPVCLDKEGNPEFTKFGQVKVKLNDTEIRTKEGYPDWFPLYPGEILEGEYDAHIIRKNESLKIRVVDEYTTDDKTVISFYQVLP